MVEIRQVSDELAEIQDELKELRKTVPDILDMVTNIRYLDGIEEIEAGYFSFMKGTTSMILTDSFTFIDRTVFWSEIFKT